MENNIPDHDPQETQEWLDALQSVLENEGADRAHYLIEPAASIRRASLATTCPSARPRLISTPFRWRRNNALPATRNWNIAFAR